MYANTSQHVRYVGLCSCRVLKKNTFLFFYFGILIGIGIGIGIEVGMTWGSVKNSGGACVFCTVPIRGAKPPLYVQYKIHKHPQSFWHSLKSFQLQSLSQFLISPLFYLFTFLVIQSSDQLLWMSSMLGWGEYGWTGCPQTSRDHKTSMTSAEL